MKKITVTVTETEQKQASIRAVVTEILEIITARYIGSGRPLPDEIMKIKDETMDIYLKSTSETDMTVLDEFEVKAKVIRERLAKGL